MSTLAPQSSLLYTPDEAADILRTKVRTLDVSLPTPVAIDRAAARRGAGRGRRRMSTFYGKARTSL